jgi:hypothetical protein
MVLWTESRNIQSIGWYTADRIQKYSEHRMILWKEFVPTLIGEPVNGIVPRDYYPDVVPKMVSFICQMNGLKR